ncbi:type II toxin-antitoxin system VapB family antitoxin [Methyloraptor flagellatus]|uniref:Type II toxin-antitoxin system VapB family antitoxin n=1 Tax=Methyloraptor flagellatus TaxID=3162530 RepID=A0AAU7X5A6_9HYPH
MLNIKRAETYELAKQVAERTGQSLTDAVTEALRDKLEKLPDAGEEAAARADVEEILDLARRWREAMGPDLKTREEYDALLYDENGLPK